MPDKIKVTTTPEHVTLMAGETAEVTATLRNLGQTVDQLTVTIDGVNPSWYTLPVSSVALFPNDQDDLKITIHPPSGEETSTGRHPVKIIASSQENPGESATAELTIEIREILEVEVEVSPQQIVGRKGTYQIVVTNPSMNKTTVNLKASDAKNRLRYQFNIPSLTVDGGSRSGASLQVKLGWLAFLGGKKEFDFQVAAMLPDEKPSPTFCSYCGRKLKPDPEGTRIVCPYCDRKLKEGAQIADAQLVRSPLIKGMPSIRIPWFSRTPVIDTFSATTDDKREFLLTWSVKRTKDVWLGDEFIGKEGEKSVHPSQMTSYTLTASKKEKSVSQTIEVHPLTVPQAQTSEKIKASLTPTDLQAHAGTIPANATLQVQNLGEIVDKFTIEIHGLDEAWVKRSASSIALMPQATDQVQLMIQPPKKQGVKSGEYSFAIGVRSESSHQEVTIVPGKLMIMPAPEYKLNVRPVRISCRRKGTFRVGIANTSVTDIDFNIDAVDMEEGCKFKLKDHDSKLAAWSSVEVPLIVKPKRGSIIGKQKSFDINIDVTDSDGNAQKAICQLNHKPFIGSWKTVFKIIRALIVFAILGVIIYHAIHWGGGWDALTDDPGQWAEDLIDGTHSPLW